MKRSLVFCAGLLLAAAAWARPGAAAPDPMEAAARRFLDALGPDLAKKAKIPFGDAERSAWNFLPGAYPGVLLAEMNAAQREAAHELLRSALSAQGYLKTTSIFALDLVLREMAARRGNAAPARDPERYAFAVFGDPSSEHPWGWRVQGHHVSLNFTSVPRDAVAATPLFLGSNPAAVREGPSAGLAVLASEDDLGRALFASFDESQRKEATIAAAAPEEVLLGPGRAADFLGEAKGLPGSRMGAAQRATLAALLDAYVGNLRPDLAAAERGRLLGDGLGAIRFAWAGGAERGQGHYYRIQGKSFVVELDNTQDGANHVHTVWRDLGRDFGGDPLAEHLRRAHK